MAETTELTIGHNIKYVTVYTDGSKSKLAAMGSAFVAYKNEKLNTWLTPLKK